MAHISRWESFIATRFHEWRPADCDCRVNIPEWPIATVLILFKRAELRASCDECTVLSNDRMELAVRTDSPLGDGAKRRLAPRAGARICRHRRPYSAAAAGAGGSQDNG